MTAMLMFYTRCAKIKVTNLRLLLRKEFQWAKV